MMYAGLNVNAARTQLVRFTKKYKIVELLESIEDYCNGSLELIYLI